MILNAIEQNRQVHSTFSHPINLYPMPDNAIIEILRRRCSFLKEHENYIKPYENDTVKKLYNLMNKSLRYTFKVLEDATIISEQEAPCVVTMNEIQIVQEKEKKEILSKLTDTQSKIVRALLEHPKMMQKEISKKTGIGVTNLTTPIRELYDKGILIIQQKTNDKRIKQIKLSEDTYLKLCFASDSLNEKTNTNKTK